MSRNTLHAVIITPNSLFCYNRFSNNISRIFCYIYSCICTLCIKVQSQIFFCIIMLYGTSSLMKIYHGISWYTMTLHGKLWYTVVYLFQNTTAFYHGFYVSKHHGLPWFPWYIMVFYHDLPWFNCFKTP